jgi:two-component system, sensor histidine kinase and response regulator
MSFRACRTSSKPRWLPPSVAAIVVRVRRALRGPPTSSHAWPSSLERPFPDGLRVLVADDNPSNLGHARDLLGFLGITPTVATNGADAVFLACERRFDVILMDLRMPVLDGLVATKQIRRFEFEQSCSRTPVLAYTSHPIDERLLRHCGLDGALAKPCSAHVLQACLLRWCAPGHSATSGPVDVRALPMG